MVCRGDGGDGGDGCGGGGLENRRWRRWRHCQVNRARAGRREGALVEARVAWSMVARSEAVMVTGVALVMGAGIAAMAAVNGGRLGGGGSLDRARGAATIPGRQFWPLMKGAIARLAAAQRRPHLRMRAVSDGLGRVPVSCRSYPIGSVAAPNDDSLAAVARAFRSASGAAQRSSPQPPQRLSVLEQCPRIVDPVRSLNSSGRQPPRPP